MDQQVNEYIDRIDNLDYQIQFKAVVEWLLKTYPQIKSVYKWNKPMFTDHGTYIIGFSVATKHFTVLPEAYVFQKFLPQIEARKLKHGKKTFQVPFDQEIPYELLKEIIQFTINDKRDVQTFWDERKNTLDK